MRSPESLARGMLSKKGGEQSYESMVPTKVGNRRAPERGDHGTHWRDGTNKLTYLPKETWRDTELGKT